MGAPHGSSSDLTSACRPSSCRPCRPKGCCCRWPPAPAGAAAPPAPPPPAPPRPRQAPQPQAPLLPPPRRQAQPAPAPLRAPRRCRCCRPAPGAGGEGREQRRGSGRMHMYGLVVRQLQLVEAPGRQACAACGLPSGMAAVGSKHRIRQARARTDRALWRQQPLQAATRYLLRLGCRLLFFQSPELCAPLRLGGRRRLSSTPSRRLCRGGQQTGRHVCSHAHVQYNSALGT